MNDTELIILEKLCEHDKPVLDRDTAAELYGTYNPKQQKYFIQNVKKLVELGFVESINPKGNRMENFNFGILLKATANGKRVIRDYKLSKVCKDSPPATLQALIEVTAAEISDIKDMIRMNDKRITKLEKSIEILLSEIDREASKLIKISDISPEDKLKPLF